MSDMEVKPVIKLGKICDEAKTIVNGARQDEYGTPAASFGRIAEYWNAYMAHTRKEGRFFTAKDVAMMMILFKIARQENKHKHDNLTDIIGYTALLDYMYELEEYAKYGNKEVDGYTTLDEKTKAMISGYNGE